MVEFYRMDAFLITIPVIYIIINITNENTERDMNAVIVLIFLISINSLTIILILFGLLTSSFLSYHYFFLFNSSFFQNQRDIAINDKHILAPSMAN